MAADGSIEGNAWPMPKFRFEVSWEGMADGIAFQEVSGLETETQVIEYRHSNSPDFSTIKMPGLAKTGNVTLKKGIFVNDNRFWSWYNDVKMNTIKRTAVVIKLLDEQSHPVMTWTLMNAWPTRVSAVDLKSDSNEVAVETMEIAHEGLSIKNS